METERIIVIQRRLKLSRRVCADCGTEFTGWGRQRFCSPNCQKRADYAVHAEQRRAARRTRYRRQREDAPVVRTDIGTATPDEAVLENQTGVDQ